MTLTLVDWLVIGGYFALNLAIGLYYARRARGSTTEFFLSGRNVPWWLAGTSMVATTFAADTPLVVTGMVARYGIAGNWLWWNMAASGMLTVFVYARLWRRAGVMTDVEFAELRYSGRPAAFLRGFRALYLGIPINCIVMGWVNLAMLKILQVTLGLDASAALWALLALLIFTAFYTTLAGLWGVLVTDLVQFVLKMGMVVALAYFAVRATGGLTALESKVRALDAAAGGGSRLAFFPSTDSAWMPAITLFVYLGVSWWASWYPGAEPGGGGYVAQRIFSAKTERDGLFATLWFNIAHYAVRPWPWILTALASLVLYPNLVDKESGYVRTLMDPNVFPPALRGIMLAAFAFSAVIIVAVGTLLMTGCINTMVLVQRPEALIGTEYGRILLLKLSLVAIMIAIAICNRLVFSPRILLSAQSPGSDAENAMTLYRSVAMEQAIGVLVLAAVAVLGTTHPIP
jgi:Na+/proline symporter